MKLVVDDVPAKAPNNVAPESASKARRSLGSLPSAPTSPARVATPTSVPAVSNTSTSSMERITVSMERLNALAMSNCKNTGAGEGGSAATPWKAASPSSQPAKATPSIPITTAPAICRAASAAISANPTSAAAGANAEKSPNATSVAGLSTTMPALRKPTKATNSPMPAAMPSFKLRGIALMSHSRTGSTLSVTNSTPERNTAPSAACQWCPEPTTTA